MQKQLAEETKKLQAMEEEHISKERARSEALSDPAQIWLEMFPHVLEAAKEHLEEGNKENFPVEGNRKEILSIHEVLEEIYDALMQKAYDKALYSLKLALVNFPDVPELK